MSTLNHTFNSYICGIGKRTINYTTPYTFLYYFVTIISLFHTYFITIFRSESGSNCSKKVRQL